MNHPDSAPPTHGTWTTNLFFRRWLALSMREQGLRFADFKPPYRTAPGEFESESPITGIRGWSFAVSTATKLELSRTLDRARRIAEQDGNDRYAAFIHRPSRQPEESYVLLDLQTLISILNSEAA